ncbi:hypothetical protein [Nonomuraea sp. NPDC049141]
MSTIVPWTRAAAALKAAESEAPGVTSASEAHGHHAPLMCERSWLL